MWCEGAGLELFSMILCYSEKYQSRAVIDSLLDILEGEEDPDVKVVAAMSLAHAASGIKVFKARAEEG